MTLSAASALLYWPARNDAIPIVGGKPVHTRNSAGMAFDERGVLYPAIINTPRFRWDPFGTERQRTLLLELAKTNPLLYSTDFSNAAWTKTNCSVATGVADPAGGTSACTITATGASAEFIQTLAAGASMIRTSSLWMRRRAGSGVVQLFSPLAGSPVNVALTSVWQRFSVTGAAGTGRNLYVAINTNGDAIDVYNGQIDDGPFATSDIVTTSAAVTRSADSFYFDFPYLPQGMMIYSKHVEAGLDTKRLWQIGDAGNSTPLLKLIWAGAYSLFYVTAVDDRSVAMAASPVLGDIVELVALFTSAGAVQLIQSINGAAVSSTSASTGLTLATAWSGLRFWLNSVGTTAIGANRFADLKVVKYADVAASSMQGIMDELRGFELGPNGDLLSSGS